MDYILERLRHVEELRQQERNGRIKIEKRVADLQRKRVQEITTNSHKVDQKDEQNEENKVNNNNTKENVTGTIVKGIFFPPEMWPHFSLSKTCELRSSFSTCGSIIQLFQR